MELRRDIVEEDDPGSRPFVVVPDTFIVDVEMQAHRMQRR
jgi:hypothetical protein